MADILLETIHGSRLYGLARPDSDTDTYRVVLGGQTRQHVSPVHGTDVLTVTLPDFLTYVAQGSHQALEALWSPIKTVDSRYAPLFAGLHPDLANATSRYVGAIINMGTQHGKTRITGYSQITMKYRRHMLRLASNLRDLFCTGGFNPVCDASTVTWLDETAASDRDTFVHALTTTCPVTLEGLPF